MDDAGIPREGALRRSLVKPQTRSLYTKLGTTFNTDTGSDVGTPPTVLDPRLDIYLNDMFFAGDPLQTISQVFYSVLWLHGLPKTLFPLATASRLNA